MEEKKALSNISKFGVSLIIIFLTFTSAIWVYCYWKNAGVDDENGYNSIDSVISLFTLIFTIITAFLAYYAFQNTKNEFKRNKKDTEFNRVIDLVYKQLNYTDVKIQSDKRFKSMVYQFDRMLDFNYGDFESRFLKDSRCFNREKYLFNFLADELEIYYNIFSHSRLATNDRKFLISMVINNIDKRLLKNIDVFQSLYRDFKSTEAFKQITTSDGAFNDLNDIDFNLNLIIQYLYIKKIDGLDLGE